MMSKKILPKADCGNILSYVHFEILLAFEFNFMWLNLEYLHESIFSPS